MDCSRTELFTDLDGTLFNSAGEVSREAAAHIIREPFPSL